MDISEDAVSSLATIPVVDYINTILIGDPINLLNLKDVFIKSVSEIISPKEISNILLIISINGYIKPPREGSELVYGSDYSYFITSSNAITIKRAR